MIYVTGNEGIPAEYRMYSLLTWHDTQEQELSWGLRSYRKPEGIYANHEFRLYTIEHLIRK